MTGYRDLAEDLRRRINAGEWPRGTRLPQITDLMEEYGVAKQTARAALAELSNQGLITVRRRYGTVVRDRRLIHIPLDRYERLRPGLGPWESAVSEQGLIGEMVTDAPAAQKVTAPDDVADLLLLEHGTPVVVRRRRAMADGEIVQLHEGWYPLDIAQAAHLDQPGKIVGGIARALAEAGVSMHEASEHVTARVPTQIEASKLGIGTRMPVLLVDRVTVDQGRRPVELMRTVGASDRLQLIYSKLPVTAPAQREDDSP